MKRDPSTVVGIPASMLLCAAPCLFIAGWLYFGAVRCSGGEECLVPGLAYLVFGLPLQIAGLALMCGAAIVSARPGEKLAAVAVTVGASATLSIVMLVAPG